MAETLSLALPGPIHVVILTALTVESKAVQSFASGPIVEGFIMDTLYSIFDYRAYDGTVLRVACSEVGDGNVAAAAEVGRVSMAHPKAILLFVGIAGAFKDLSIGDVIAGEDIIYTATSKISKKGKLFRPKAAASARDLVQVARMISRKNFHAMPHAAQLKIPPKAIVGQIASGEELVKTEGYREELGLRVSSAVAIEMEGYGFAQAASTSGRMRCLVVRGISDAANEGKNDADHANASQAAAAFAFTVLDELIRLHRIEHGNDPVQELVGVTPPQASAPGDQPAADWVERLATDEDLLPDTNEGVAARAATDFASAMAKGELSYIHNLTLALVDRIDDSSVTWAARRLRAYGRELARGMAGACDADAAAGSQDDLMVKFPIDEMLQQNLTGAGVMLSRPEVWPQLDDTAKRRVLSGLMGTATEPRVPTETGWRCLVALWEGGCLEADTERVQSALHLTSYELLLAASVPLPLVQVKLAADLETGNFSRQNAAARFLYRDAGKLPGSLDESTDVELGRSLERAARGNANGAVEALGRSNLASMSSARRAGVLLGALFFDNSILRMEMPETERVVLAASSVAGDLAEVLTIAQARLPPVSRETDVDATFAERLWAAIVDLGSDLGAEDQAVWNDFLTALRPYL